MKYSVKRSKLRKRLCLRYCALNGLEVLAPIQASDSFISKFVFDHKYWIDKQKSLLRLYNIPRHLDFGISIFLYGKSFQIVKSETSLDLIQCLDSKLFVSNDWNCSSSDNDSSNSLKDLLSPWIKKKSDDYLLSRLNYWVSYLKILNVDCRFKWLKTRWGSCSSKRNINLNRCLLGAPIDVLDYVIVHELCHLKEMNHSKKFWKLVKEIIPEFKEKMFWLKKHQLALMALNMFK